MARHLSRRELLQLGATTPLTVGGSVVASPPSGPATQRRGEAHQSTSITGRVQDPHGTGTSAKIWLYDNSGTAETAVKSTTTDGKGKFTLSDVTLPAKPLVVVKEIETREPLFGTLAGSPAEFAEPIEVTLQKQLVYGPQVGMLNETRLGCLSIWRRVETAAQPFSSAESAGQTLFLEISEVTHTNQNRHEWKIDTAPPRLAPQRYTIQDSFYVNNPVREGSFTLSVPEFVTIDYDGDLGIAGDAALQLWRAIDQAATSEQRRLQRWHPTLTGIPAFVAANENFARLTQGEQQRAEQIEAFIGTLATGLGKTAVSLVTGGSSTGVSLLFLFANTLYEFRESVDDSPPPKLDGSESIKTDIDKNTYDTIAGEFDAGAGLSSVVFQIPFQIQKYAVAEPILQVGWNPEKGPRVQFTQNLALRPDIEANQVPVDGRTDPPYELAYRSMCKAVGTHFTDTFCAPPKDNRDDFTTDDGTYIFAASDTQILSWVELLNVREDVTMRWNWYTPDGLLYTVDTDSIDGSVKRGLGTASLPLNQWSGEPKSKPATLPGEWSVDVTVETISGSKTTTFTQRFIIET